MERRRLGKTGLMVSEVGFGGEWLERHSTEECACLLDHAASKGINILDCWMSEPKVRTNIGKALAGKREKWIIQGHIGSTWQEGQYVRTRDAGKCREAFQDLLDLLGTDYIDLGMIHYVDQVEDWEAIQDSPYLDYVKELREKGTIRHVGLSTHNPVIGKLAAESGLVEMILFSINPAFDLMPPTDDIDKYFAEECDGGLAGIDPARREFYQLCEQLDVGLTVMKPFAGGRLFDEKRSPFGVPLTPVQCIHYCLTRPAVASALCGYDTTEQIDAAAAYETASPEERDYASVLAGAPKHAYKGGCTYCGHCKPCPAEIDIAMVNKLYDLAVMQPEVPAPVREHYFALSRRADECLGCRQCESRCPFGVPVSRRMAEAAALFGR